jgi:hypothetical protein
MSYLIVGGMVTFAVSVRACGGRVADILGAYAKPVLIASVSVLVGYLAAKQAHLLDMRWQGLVRILAASLIASTMYLSIMYCVGRDLLIDSLARVVDAAPSAWRSRLGRFVPQRKAVPGQSR